MSPAATLLPTIRVLIADDHQLFQEALQAIIETDGQMAVAGLAENGLQAVELARSLRPDIVLMDISMPVLDGIAALEQIRAADGHACVLVLTGSDSPHDVDRARRAGAAGYVTKDRIAEELIGAIRAIVSR
ncbi:MAG: response regulator transcription factor [Actinobacteria bacterium]|nr:response regulator transcription factor [Actinomycetota bacterium]